MSRRSNPTLDPTVQRELAEIDTALSGADATGELADLVRDLRAERPSPDPEFSAALDIRVAEGFAVAPRAGQPRGGRVRGVARRLLPSSGWRLMPVMAGAATVLVALVVAVSVLREDDYVGSGGSTAGAPSLSAAPPELESGDDMASPPTAATPRSGKAGGGEALNRRERRVEREASLALTAPPERIEDVADGVVRVTDRFGGIVASSSVTRGEQGSATFDLRVPVERLGESLAELSKLAHVRSRTQSSQDVTQVALSAEERVREAEAERSSLLRQLAQADTATEAESLRARLRDANRALESARSSVASVNERTNFSRISLTIQSDEADDRYDEPGAWGPGDALEDAVRILQFAGSLLIVTVALLLPFLMLGLVAAYVARLVVRRRREQALGS